MYIVNGLTCTFNLILQTFIVLENYSTARSEKYFQDALEFKPERWLRGNKDQSHPFSNVPFGFGPRMCLGKYGLYLKKKRDLHRGISL